MELVLLYLWLKLDTIIGIFAAGCCLFLILSVVRLMACDSECQYSETQEKKAARWARHRPTILRRFLIACAFAFVSVSIPSRTEVAVLLGGHYALKAVNTPEAAKVMSVMRKKANEILDKELAK